MQTSFEAQYARTLVGLDYFELEKPSVLMTDAYKFSMAQAGFPLREETFCLTLRKGGPFYIPFDFEEVVQHLLPNGDITLEEMDFLSRFGFGLTPAMRSALNDTVSVSAAPKGSWVLAGEPVLTVTGPSFLASWLEPLVIMFNHAIQIATALKLGHTNGFATTNHDERRIILLVAKALGVETGHLSVDDTIYRSEVLERANAIRVALDGDTHRAFEVGLRAATCMSQHVFALRALQEEGITKTSNLFGAHILRMTPVGSTGHEHQQRWGNDLDAYRAIRDMRPQPPSYLFDAFDPMLIGIPAAIEVMLEDPDRACAVRFDSGDQDAQLRAFVKAEKDRGISPNYIFEDGYTAEKAVKNEALCDTLGILRDRRMYGFGGYLINAYDTGFGRDRVSAAYKLAQSGGRPTMKFSGSPGKESIPGKPVIYRRIDTSFAAVPSVVAQEGEEFSEAYAPLDPANPLQPSYEALAEVPRFLSPATERLVDACKDARAEMKRDARRGH